jgi:NTP pyrophosphatase (non-canonical NTP hydrolase)
MLELNTNNKEMVIAEGVDALVALCHSRAADAGWWNKEREVGTSLMLIVSEISEAMEAARKNQMDDKLVHRKGVEVELGDAIIRICDFAGKYGYDLSGAILEKLEYNLHRLDHKLENRVKEGGKAW